MFGDSVRFWRRRLGMTQDELAARTGLSTRTIGKLEAGQITHPRPATVRLLADGLGLSGTDLDEFTAAAAHGEPAESRAMHWYTPAQLPADIPDFTGRAEELAQLGGLLDRRTGPTGHHPVTIAAIGGTPGVGKTALAIHWAHRVRHRFPDGQLYIDLRGYDVEQPTPASVALAGLLRALGVRAGEVPASMDENSALFRSLLDGRRVLVILDNASSVEQVRPLLPGSATCVTVVTSRDSLGGLVARHGATRIGLDLLPPDDAIALLGTLVGRRVSDDPTAALTLAQQCAYLPLALRVAAELAVARPTTPLAGLVAELHDEHRRLELLDAGGDDRTAVRAVFSWSYRNLPEPCARLFRLLGQHPGADLDVRAAAALLSSTVDEATVLLDQLVRAHLSRHIAPGRYGMHDLLKAYARLTVAADESDVERRMATQRLLDHYVDTAEVAAVAAYPFDHTRPESVRPATALIDPQEAYDWLEAELTNLPLLTAHAAEEGWPGHAVRLSNAIEHHLDQNGHVPEALAVHTSAADAARRNHDAVAEARTLAALARTQVRTGSIAPVGPIFERVAELARSAGDHLTEIRARTNVAAFLYFQGRLAEAVPSLEAAMDMAATYGHELAENTARTNLGICLWRLGRTAEGAQYLEQALAVWKRTGYHNNIVDTYSSMVDMHCRYRRLDQALAMASQALESAVSGHSRIGRATALSDLGMIHTHLGEPDIALDYLEQARGLFESSYSFGAAHALLRIGEVRRRQGRLDEAADLMTQALERFRATQNLLCESEVLHLLGLVRLEQGRLDDAYDVLRQALGTAQRCGLAFRTADAHAGLARVHELRGEPAAAGEHRHRAVRGYEALGAPVPSEISLPSSNTRSGSGPQRRRIPTTVD